MWSRALTLSLLLLPAAARAQAPIEILGRSGAMRVPDDAGVEAASGPRECPSEAWTFEVNLPSATTTAPAVWARARFACSLGERAQPNASCVELCGATRNACGAPLPAGGSRYRFTIPTRWLVDPVDGQCVAASGRRAVFLVVGEDVVALSPRRVRYDLLPPAPPREVDLTNHEDRVEVRWSYGSTGSGASDAGADVVDPTDVVDASVSDVVDVGVVDAGASTVANGGEEAAARFHVLCDPPPGADTPLMDGGTCGTNLLGTLDLSSDELLARHRCAPAQPSSSRAAALAGLRLGARHQVAVVVEDLAGNRSRVALAPRCAAPLPVTDFWESYRGAGGAGEPGFCAARPGVSRSPLALLALAIVALALRLRR